MKAGSPVLAALAAEHGRRLGRARDAMAVHGVDALVLSDPANFFYFTGFMRPFTPWTGYIKARPFIVVVPQEGTPIVLVQLPYERAGREGARIAEVATWSSLPFRAEYLAGVLSNMDLSAKTLAFEIGPGERLDFPFQEYVRLKSLLPRARFVDSSVVTRSTRACKSDLELRWIADVHRVSLTAFRRCLGLVTSDMDRARIVRSAKEQLFGVGCDDVGFCRVITGTPTVGEGSGGGSSSAGAAVCISGGGILGGYRAIVTVQGAVGASGAQVTGPPQDVLEVLRRIAEELQPGHLSLAVADRCQRVVARHGRRLRVPIGGLVAHGLGLDTCEAPWIGAGDRTELEEGMVLSVGVEHRTPSGWFPLRETYVLTKDAAVAMRGSQGPSEGDTS